MLLDLHLEQLVLLPQLDDFERLLNLLLPKFLNDAILLLLHVLELFLDAEDVIEMIFDVVDGLFDLLVVQSSSSS